jgi:fibronectin-binding autotransporter adhesin
MKSDMRINRRRTVGARAVSAATIQVGLCNPNPMRPGARRFAGAPLMSAAALGVGLCLYHPSVSWGQQDVYQATQAGSANGGTGVDGGWWFDGANWLETANGTTAATSPNTANNEPINVDATTYSTLPQQGLIFDPVNDPYNTGSVMTVTYNSGTASHLYISSASATSTLVQANTFTVDSGSLETYDAIVGRDGPGEMVQNGGTYIFDITMQVGMSHNSGAQNGIYDYTGGTLWGAVNPQTDVGATGSSRGIRLGNVAGSTGTFIVDNSGSTHGNAGSIQVDNYYAGGYVSGGVGITDFVYDGAGNDSEYPTANGGVVPIQVTGGTTTGEGQLAIRNYSATEGTGTTDLELTLDAAPEVTDGVPQNLALFIYEDGIHGQSTFSPVFSNVPSGTTPNYFLTEGSTVTAVYQNTTYVWDIYYDGSVGFSNANTSQIDSITQTGGNTSTGSAGAVVLIGEGIITPVGNGVWAASTGGSWQTASDWSNSIIPAAIPVTFGSAIGVNSIVTLDGNETVSGITFSNSFSYTIAQGSSGSLFINNGATAAPVTVSLGTHTISAPVVLGSNVSVTVTNPGDDLILSGNVSGTGGLTLLAGSGSLTLSGSNTYSGGTTVKAGALVLTDPGALPGAGLNVLNNANVLVEGGTSSAPIYAGNIVGGGNLTVGDNGVAGYLKLASASGGILQSSLALGASSAAKPVSIFNDNLTTSTTNSGSTAAPTATSTNYDIASSKAATNSGINTPGDLTLSLDTATTSGFSEAQALFTSTPKTLVNPNDAIELDVTFKDTSSLLAGGASSSIVLGLFNSGSPQSYPDSGLNNSGLNSTAGSSFATGGTSLWQGYVGRFAAAGGNNEAYTRPLQNGAGTTSANQDLLFNAADTSAYSNPAGTQIGGSQTSTFSLSTGSVYTADMLITLLSSGQLSIADTLYSGAGTNGSILQQQSGLDATSTFTPSFDGLAFGIRNSGTSLQPIMDVSNVSVSFLSGTPVTETGTLDLNGNSATAGGLTGSGTLDNVSAGGSVSLTLNGSGTSTFGGVIRNTSGNVGVTLSSGTQVMTGNNTYSGPTILNGGALIADSAGGLSPNSAIVNNSNLVIDAGTSSSPVVSGNLSGTGNLIIGNSTTPAYLRLAANSHTSSVKWSALQLSSNSTLDIANDTLAINYAGSSDPVTSVVSLLTTGYGAGGNWKGTAGILSSTAGNGGLTPLLSVGYADGNNPYDLSRVAGLQTNQILIKYTLAGDAILAGTVNFNDLLIVAQNFNKTGEDWVGGNFIYNPTGLVNFNDLLIVAQNFNKVLSPAGSSDNSLGGSTVPLQATVDSVPEPTALSLVAIGAAGMLARRKRNRSA